MEERKLDKYIVNEEVRLALRNIVLTICKDIPYDVYKDLLKIINEDSVTDFYIDCINDRYKVVDEEETGGQEGFDHGWYV